MSAHLSTKPQKEKLTWQKKTSESKTKQVCGSGRNRSLAKRRRKCCYPKGHLVTKLADTNNPDWWQVRASFQGADVEGFSNKNLLLADAAPGPSPVTGSIGELITKTLTVLTHVAPKAHPNYLQAVRERPAIRSTRYYDAVEPWRISWLRL